jgi:hypothetical protein
LNAHDLADVEDLDGKFLFAELEGQIFSGSRVSLGSVGRGRIR